MKTFSTYKNILICIYSRYIQIKIFFITTQKHLYSSVKESECSAFEKIVLLLTSAYRKKGYQKILSNLAFIERELLLFFRTIILSYAPTSCMVHKNL